MRHCLWEANVIIGVSEGDRYRFEVLLMSDGFIVRARSTDTGEVLECRDRMFRTAPAAFAFAELSAMRDAEDAVPAETREAAEAHLATDRAARLFAEVRARLADSGVSAVLLHAWDRRAQLASEPSMN
jgi:hypothetical protein